MATKSKLATQVAQTFPRAILGILLLVCLGSCSRPSLPPRLVVSPDPLELGEGTPGEELHGSITLRNEGGATLRIEDARAGCACSALQLSQSLLAPGEQVTLHVTTRIGREGERLAFTVQIDSNDPDNPRTAVLVRARSGPPPVHAEPSELEFGEVAVGNSPVHPLMLRRRDGRSWTPKAPPALTSAKGLVLLDRHSPPHGPPEATATFIIALRPGLPRGPFEDTLTLRLPDSGRTIRIPVRGTIVPRLVVSPTTLYFGDIETHATPVRRLFQVRRTDGKPLAPLIKTDAPRPLTLDQVPRAAGPSPGRGEFRVSLNPAQVTTDLRQAEVRLWFQGEPEPVAVRVLVFRRPATRRAPGSAQAR